jgi:hypothetical protein
MSEENEIRESVDEAKSPGTFNILDVLKDRGYPQTTVEVYLDESAMYEISVLKEKLAELDKKSVKNSSADANATKREEIEAEIKSLSEKLDKSKYTIHLMGVSEGRREEFFRAAVKKYPVEYDNGNGISNLLGVEAQRIEKPSPERDALFTDYLWQGHIKKIVNHEGDEQTEFAYSVIRNMRESFPLNAMVKINEAIEKLRLATAVFTVETDEDFLAKP